MTTVLKDLFTSKKFLVALSAIIVYIGGRFGFDVDPAALDRIFAALLVYVGGQAVADAGKSAALIRAAAPANDNAIPLGVPREAQAGRVGIVVMLVLALGGAGLALSSGCATARPRATAGLDAMLDCTAPARAAVVADLGKALVDYARKFISGDGATVNIDKLKASATALKGEVIGSCGLVTALAILATPKPEAARSLLAAPPTGPDPEQWRDALEAVQIELNVRAAAGG